MLSGECGWFGRMRLPLFAGALTLLVLELWTGWYHVGGDFRIYLESALRFTNETSTLYAVHSNTSLVGFLYPPPSILLFLPLTQLETRQAYGLFLLVSYAVAAAALWGWTKLMRDPACGLPAMSDADAAVLVLFGLASGPMFAAAIAGQIDPIVLAFCTGYVLLLRQSRGVAAGAVLAVGFWIKIYPALLLIHAMRTPEARRVLAGFLLGGALLPLVCFPVVPFDLYRLYFLDLLPDLSARTLVATYNQSAIAFLTRLDLPITEALRPAIAYKVAGTVKFAVYLAAAAAILICVRITRGRKEKSLVLAASLLALVGPIAPLGWAHAYVYVLPLLGLCLGFSLRMRKIAPLAIVTVAFGAMLLPAYRRMDFLADAPDVLQNLIYSRYLFSTLAILVLTWALIPRYREWERA